MSFRGRGGGRGGRGGRGGGGRGGGRGRGRGGDFSIVSNIKQTNIYDFFSNFLQFLFFFWTGGGYGFAPPTKVNGKIFSNNNV